MRIIGNNLPSESLNESLQGFHCKNNTLVENIKGQEKREMISVLAPQNNTNAISQRSYLEMGLFTQL